MRPISLPSAAVTGELSSSCSRMNVAMYSADMWGRNVLGPGRMAAALALPAGASAQKVDFGAAPIDKWTIVDGQASAG